LTIGGAAVMNPVPVLAKHGEAAVALKQLGLPTASRKGAFALPSQQAKEQLLAALA
jgi:hypothetical protein